jgi:hypothetical protein
VFSITLDTAEWLNDYEQRDPATGKPKKDLVDLVTKVGVNLVKLGLATVLGVVVMSLAGMALAASTSLSLPMIAIVVGTVAVGALVGVGLEYLDKKIGLTQSAAGYVREATIYLEGKIPKDYKNYTKTLPLIPATEPTQ